MFGRCRGSGIQPRVGSPPGTASSAAVRGSAVDAVGGAAEPKLGGLLEFGLGQGRPRSGVAGAVSAVRSAGAGAATGGVGGGAAATAGGAASALAAPGPPTTAGLIAGVVTGAGT